ncbi:MAG TPA: acyltransferase, partial [Thermoanaerobaculia bacterium]|nr:acyltransferase [Thermoanaerobaculia bacterium]
MTAERLPALDGLRGLAILLVLLLHFTVYGGPPATEGIDKLFYRAAQAGWIGVDLFFVLSGFLITGILYDAKGGENYFRSFYARRVLRIFPLYYGALAVFLLLVPALRPGSFWHWTYLSNVQIAREGWPDSGALGHFWSLAVEEQFYLFWPVAVLLLARRSLMAACWVCLAGSLLLRVGLHLADQETAAFVLTPARLDSLAAGALLALAARGPEGLAPVARRAGAMAGICA